MGVRRNIQFPDLCGGSVDKDYNAGTPKCGFIFPAFEDRSAEPGKIDVFFEIPEHPDEGFLNRIIEQ